MKYAWSSISKSTCNYGNWLIEDSLKQILKLDRPELVFDSFKPLSGNTIKQINETCELVISPGCTTLQPGQNIAYDQFDKIDVPIPSFGGAVWNSGIRSKYRGLLEMFSPLVRYRGDLSGASQWVISTEDSEKLSSVAKRLAQPVGCRDPYTHQVMQQEGINSILIGCPTLLAPVYSEKWAPLISNRLLFSFSRNNIPYQIWLVNQLSKKWKISVVIHEPYEYKFLKLLKNIEVIKYRSPGQYFREYAAADLVITGRLHGALPSIRSGTRVIFFGNPADTRFTLLEWLGCPIRRLSSDLLDCKSYPEVANPTTDILRRVSILRSRFIQYASEYNIETHLESV